MANNNMVSETKASKKVYGAGRTRNFASVVYPDSAPPDWREQLALRCIPAFVSPLHDRDTNPEGEVKKPHWHVMVMFDNVKTDAQAQEVFTAIGGVGLERVNSVRGYARYLCHLDNPEKHRYLIGDVCSCGGADYLEVISLQTDKYAAIGEMIDYCKANDVFSYALLLEYARGERPDWFRVLCSSGTIVVKEYLKSRAWTVQSGR